MKKNILVLAVFAAGLIVIASCKKDRTCGCTVTTTGSFTSTSTYDTTFVDMSKSDAKAACDGLDASASVFGTTVTSECELK